ncbi:Homoserine dehydrogenase [Perkinsus olseni]|uniref:aspartate kinase n=1 Tax=Perkinsus olseni TaxID=32597 RepID=A0A7J6TG56_PEROL|nr:Homoserine dehydrogenase [Perkinsus olseni]
MAGDDQLPAPIGRGDILSAEDQDGAWSVHKFGGTSMGSPEAIWEVADIIAHELRVAEGKGRIAAVVSAMSGVTNSLCELCGLAQRRVEWEAALETIKARHFECIAGNLDHFPEYEQEFDKDAKKISCCLDSVRVVGVCPQPFYDVIMGYGELWSARILCGILKRIGVRAAVVDGRRIIYLEEGSDRVDWQRSGMKMAEVEREAMEFEVVIITGFVASEASGAPTTLKRNGSDLSFSGDPRSVGNAEMLESLSYSEAAEMAWFGAKVLHPKTMAPCIGKDIPIVLRNTFNRVCAGEANLILPPGTLITSLPTPPGSPCRHQLSAKAVSVMKGICLVNVEGCGLIGVTGLASRLFGAVGEAGVNVIMITQASSEHSVCFAIRTCDREKCVVAIEHAFYREMCLYHDFGVTTTTGLAILAMVGDGMVRSIGILGRAATALASARVNICAVAQGSSERNITLVVAEEDTEAGVAALHESGCCGNGKASQMRKQELLSEQQLSRRERRERGLGEDAESERPKKRTNVEKRIAMMKEEEIKAGQVDKLLQNLRRSHEQGAPFQKWMNLANEVHYLVDELKTRELATVLMMFAEAGYVDTTQCTTAIVKRLTMRTDVTSCLMAIMALYKSAGRRATAVLEDLSETFIRLVFDKGVESPNAYNVNKMTFADLRLTAVALAKLPFLHDRLEAWFIDDLFNCLTEKVPHAKDPRTLLSIM